MNEQITSWEIKYCFFLLRLCAYMIVYLGAFREWGFNVAAAAVCAVFLIAAKL
jgi:hypothetical protein